VAYRIQIKLSARKALAKLPKSAARPIARAISRLADDPRPQDARKLTGSESSYRLRVRDYRIVYDIKAKTLTIYIIRTAHRKDVYRRI